MSANVKDFPVVKDPDLAMPDETVYKIMAPVQKTWNPKSGEWEYRKPYTGKVFGVMVVDGQAETTDRDIAIEFADMGYQVTPSPKAKATSPIRRKW